MRVEVRTLGAVEPTVEDLLPLFGGTLDGA